MSLEQVAILGGLLVTAKCLTSMEKIHYRQRKKAAESSRRAADPVTLDKGVSPGLSGFQPAPQSLRGMYAGLGASQRNTRDHHSIRGLIQSQDPDLTLQQRLHRITAQEGLGQMNSKAKVYKLFGQGRSFPIGDDYKPITTTLSYNTSVSSGMMSQVQRTQRKKHGDMPMQHRYEKHDKLDGHAHYRQIDSEKGEMEDTHTLFGDKRGSYAARRHPFLGTNTINKSQHYEPKRPEAATYPFNEVRNYQHFVNVTTHQPGRPSMHGRPSQKHEGQIQL